MARCVFLYLASIAPFRAIHMRTSLILSRLRPTATLSPQGSLVQQLGRRNVFPRPTQRVSNYPPRLFVRRFSGRFFYEVPRQANSWLLSFVFWAVPLWALNAYLEKHDISPWTTPDNTWTGWPFWWTDRFDEGRSKRNARKVLSQIH